MKKKYSEEIDNKILMDQRRIKAKEQKEKKRRENYLIKAAIERRITRSMTKKLLSDNSNQAIAAFNNLIIPNAMKLK
jgi:hypothetical protein